jgi:hypothetical protein
MPQQNTNAQENSGRRNALRRLLIACLHEILEESSEEEGEKRTSQIQALVPVVITVIQLTTS